MSREQKCLPIRKVINADPMHVVVIKHIYHLIMFSKRLSPCICCDTNITGLYSCV